MVKHWSRNNYDLIRPFHIELICREIFSTKSITNFQLGVATALVNLQGYVGQPMWDPIYGQSRVDKVLTAEEQSRLLLRVQNDADGAIGALELEGKGNDSAAIEKWKRIFLFGFPK